MNRGECPIMVVKAVTDLDRQVAILACTIFFFLHYNFFMPEIVEECSAGQVISRLSYFVRGGSTPAY